MAKREEISDKKKRGDNFSQFESEVLIDLVIKYSKVLTNKKNDSFSWKQKNDCWEKVREEFIAKTGQDRTVKTLRYKYENMKKRTRLSHSKKDINQTGDGQPTNKSQAKLEEKVASILEIATEGISNDWSSDFTVPIETVMSDNEEVEQPTILQVQISRDIRDWSNWTSSLLKTQKNEKPLEQIERSSVLEEGKTRINAEKNYNENMDIEVCEVENDGIEEAYDISQPTVVADSIGLGVPGPSRELSYEPGYRTNKGHMSKQMKRKVLNKNLVLKEQADFWKSQRRMAEEQHKLAIEQQNWEKKWKQTIFKLKEEKLLLEIQVLKKDSK